MSVFLAFDFGASSGRAIIGSFRKNENGDKTIFLKEIHRFPNDPVYIGRSYVWDFPRLLHEMKVAIKKVVKSGEEIKAIGIDTWGVDYGILDKDDNLLALPMHYRDKTNVEAMEMFKKDNSLEKLYLKTGLSNNSFNSLFQLLRDKKNRSSIYDKADSILFMPDLFAFYLTNQKRNEFTISSTSGLLDYKEKNWNYGLMQEVGIKPDIFNKIINPGEIYGVVSEEIKEEIGIGNVPIVAVGTHDTASAVIGTPFESEKSAFLSSGTWSLLGLEVKKPIISEKSYKFNLTNEGGVNGTTRLLKNINGTWLLQQLRKKWSEENEEVGFKEIIEQAKNCIDVNFRVDTNDVSLMNSKNIIKSIQQYCSKNGQGIPKKLGELAVAIYNGLTFEYEKTIKELELVSNIEIDYINIVGGGIQDKLLCEMTAKRTGKNVVTGPVEAAVLGNIMMQAIAIGDVCSVEEGRKIIKNSFDFENYKN